MLVDESNHTARLAKQHTTTKTLQKCNAGTETAAAGRPLYSARTSQVPTLLPLVVQPSIMIEDLLPAYVLKSRLPQPRGGKRVQIGRYCLTWTSPLVL